MSGVALVINLAVLALYVYSAYYMNSLSVHKGMNDIVPKQLQVYGQLKFLTFQCLLVQILSTTLHILAHFINSLRGLRDLVYTTLAYPVGSIVVYSFWAVWILLGRELILPEQMDKFFPMWLNHSVHTVIAPVNILMAMLVNHRYTKNGVSLTLLYTGLYTIFLHVIKAQTGLFVYKYLDTFDQTQRSIYFAATGFLAYILYKSGQFLTYTVHGAGQKKGSQVIKQKKQKQKQKQALKQAQKQKLK